MENVLMDETEEQLHSKQLKGKYFTFWADNQMFGVPIADVVQIVGMQDITCIPEFPEYAKGIINLRGSIIPVIDVRLRLGKPEKEYDERTCIIVTQIRQSMVGFIVDAVDAVEDIDDSSITPPPRIAGNYTSTYITGVARHKEKVALLMDTARILSDDVLDAIISA